MFAVFWIFTLAAHNKYSHNSVQKSLNVKVSVKDEVSVCTCSYDLQPHHPFLFETAHFYLFIFIFHWSSFNIYPVMDLSPI